MPLRLGVKIGFFNVNKWKHTLTFVVFYKSKFLEFLISFLASGYSIQRQDLVLLNNYTRFVFLALFISTARQTIGVQTFSLSCPKISLSCCCKLWVCFSCLWISADTMMPPVWFFFCQYEHFLNTNDSIIMCLKDTIRCFFSDTFTVSLSFRFSLSVCPSACLCLFVCLSVCLPSSLPPPSLLFSLQCFRSL